MNIESKGSMTQDQLSELLGRIFAVNEQVVRQNHQIMLVLTNPRISIDSEKNWKALTADEVDTIVANASSMKWAVLMADSTLKAKNND
jgi:hypothetical protein